jgi:hypothetical protein
MIKQFITYVRTVGNYVYENNQIKHLMIFYVTN